MDAQDTLQNAAMGQGLGTANQVRDGIDLTKAVIADLANGDATKVTVVGQSLGGGIAGVVVS